MAMEINPVEIVDLPIKWFLHGYVAVYQWVTQHQIIKSSEITIRNHLLTIIPQYFVISHPLLVTIC